MPGPEKHALEAMDKNVEDKMELLATRERTNSVDQVEILNDHQEERGRGVSIQAGLFASSMGKKIDDSLKVKEYDDEGNVELHTSTLDSFEVFWKPVVDFGLFGFAMANGGMQLDAIGPMTGLIVISLLVGKVIGIYSMYRLARVFGHFAPL